MNLPLSPLGADDGFFACRDVVSTHVVPSNPTCELRNAEPGGIPFGA
jgi:hypothetical protein